MFIPIRVMIILKNNTYDFDLTVKAPFKRIEKSLDIREEMANRYKEKGKTKNEVELENMFYVLKYILKKASLDNFVWETQLGTGNGAWTAIFSGIIIVIKENIKILIKRNIGYKSLIFSTTPSYTKISIDNSLECTIKIKIIYIIMASIKLKRK
jgi:hypothetical protein